VRIFGEIEGIAVGTEFANRAKLAASGIHKPTQAGISGSTTEGADSIVVSGGYEDDEDYPGRQRSKHQAPGC
jgi:putative restriction endonuclease